MHEVRFKCELITPLFMSGADTKDYELREQSIKGLLRFWWRMANPKNSIDELKKKEFEIFGSADKDYGKSKVIVKIENKEVQWGKKGDELPSHTVPYRARGRNIRVNILDYLAYGPVQYDKEKRKNLISLKKYIKNGSKFNIVLRSYDKKYIREVEKALKFLICFGGVGAKSRNGFGSLHCDNINCSNINLNYNNEVPSYLSFNSHIRLFRTNDIYNNWDEALFNIGKIYREIRLSLENKHNYNNRQYLSSPIMVRKRNRSFLERHAKSLFLKVRKENNGFRGYILFVPYKFLDKHDKWSEQNLSNYNRVYNDFISKLDNRKELKSLV